MGLVFRQEASYESRLSLVGSEMCMRDRANEALRGRLGIAKTSDASDLLLMIMPPGTGDWAAFSGVGHPRPVYNDLWGGYTSSLLHEVGHGLGPVS